MSKIWGIPSPYKSGPQNHLFGRLRNWKETLTAHIFWKKHDINNRSRALTTIRGLLLRPKMSRTLVHKRLQTGSPFLLVLCKFCFLRHCQASQTEISKQNSTKLCQTADGKSRQQRAVEQLGRPTRKKWGPRNFYICLVFRRFRHLMANIFWMKRDIDNRQGRWKVRRVSYIVQKFHELWSTNGFKRDQTFYPPHYFVPCQLHRTPSNRH